MTTQTSPITTNRWEVRPARDGEGCFELDSRSALKRNHVDDAALTWSTCWDSARSRAKTLGSVPYRDASATQWKDPTPRRWDLHGAAMLDVSGTLIGGCIEVMSGIAGSPYGDVRTFGRENGPLIVYLEAAEESAFNICRYLHQLRYVGWFDGAVAVLIGSTRAPAGTDDGGLTQRAAVLDALGLPIVFDMEIEHVPPHLPLLNGAHAHVVIDGSCREITQTWAPCERS